jgi:hypothetical protein
MLIYILYIIYCVYIFAPYLFVILLYSHAPDHARPIYAFSDHYRFYALQCVRGG